VIYPDDVVIDPSFTVVGCAVEYGGKVLLLQRASHKPQPGKWGMPSGKVDAGESNNGAISRELQEETGIKVQPNVFKLVGQVNVHHDGYDFIYVLYSLKVLDQVVELNNDEHSASQWIEPNRAEAEVDGIEDLVECLALEYKELL
jgi:8-oxo-dGTP pyrophosphatase MutT (NUDIX family)